MRLFAGMSAEETPQIQLRDSDTKVRLVAQGRNQWRVRMLFPRDKATEIPEQLREIKSDLARSFGVADHYLEYVSLISKRLTATGVLVEMLIKRQDIPAGAIRVRFLPMKATDGTEYSSMLAAIDIFPVDDYERQVSFETVEEKIRAEGLDTAAVRWPVLRELVQTCIEQKSPIFEQIIAEGTMPDVGLPSSIFYNWTPSTDAASASAWMGMRPVEQGDDLVELHVPVSGLKAGKNIFGKELSPRRGVITRLQAGSGVSLNSTERKMRAQTAGLLLLTRRYQDRRQKDSPREVPAVLEAEVKQFRKLLAENAQNNRWEESIWVNGSLEKNTRLTVTGDCVIFGDVAAGCEIQISGSLRIYGDVTEASLAVGNHLCSHGSSRDSMMAVGLTSQLLGEATDCTIFAREIIANEISGGTAEAYSPAASGSELVQVNREKLLAEQREAGEDALANLRRQLARLYEIFGPETIQQVTSDTVQVHLLRWLRQQKMLGITSFSHPQVQELRTLLELVPNLRVQMVSIAGELRATDAGN